MELTSKNLEMQKHIFIKMRYIAPEGQTVCRKKLNEKNSSIGAT